jgi:hypothetical protein
MKKISSLAACALKDSKICLALKMLLTMAQASPVTRSSIILFIYHPASFSDF